MHFMRDGVAAERNGFEMFTGRIGGLANGFGDLIGLAESNADLALAISHNEERTEAETSTALDDLGASVDEDNFFEKIGFWFVITTAARSAIAAGSTTTTATATTTTGREGHRGCRHRDAQSERVAGTGSRFRNNRRHGCSRVFNDRSGNLRSTVLRPVAGFFLQ